MNRVRRSLMAAAAAGLAVLSLGNIAAAHPLGNFTINHYDGIRVGVDSLLIDHVVDMAEIPTFRERAAMDTDGDGTVSDAEAATYQAATCDGDRDQLDLRVDGTALPLEVTQRGLSFPMGQGALTTRVVCVYAATLPVALSATPTTFTFRDTANSDRIGWREIVVQADATTLTDSDAPAAGISDRLTSYPTDLLTTPSAQTSATWSATAGGTALAAFTVPDAQLTGSATTPVGTPDTSTAAVPNGISELSADVAAIFQAKELTPIAILISMFAAAGLGALHAASPGHGKTVMAAYLVGSRGTSRQALGLGMTVTLSHTLGVLVLGALSLFAASVIAPERLYPILGTVSGTIVIAIGAWLVLGRVRIIRGERAEARAHDLAHATGAAHDHGHEHAHEPAPGLGSAHVHAAVDAHAGEHDHGHEHGHEHEHAHPHAEVDTQAAVHDHAPVDDGYHSHGGLRHTHLPPAGSTLSMRGLFALGLAGGMVPSVSAIILLLGSISLGRPAYGIALTVAFGIGMAVVLVGVGVLLVHARGLLDRLPARSTGMRLTRMLPTATAFVVLIAGVVITAQAAVTIR